MTIENIIIATIPLAAIYIWVEKLWLEPRRKKAIEKMAEERERLLVDACEYIDSLADKQLTREQVREIFQRGINFYQAWHGEQPQ